MLKSKFRIMSKKEGFFKSSNPAMGAFKQAREITYEPAKHDEVMTIDGAVNKSLILVAVLLASSIFTWNLMMSGAASATTWMIGGGIAGFIVALATIFKPEWSPISAPIYAVCQGLFLGAISAQYATLFSGIVFQAVGLTMTTLFLMLILYKTGIIKVTEKLRSGIIAATGAVMLMYIGVLVANMFGAELTFLHTGGIWSIGISLVVIGVAAMNLLLDFDLIDRGVEVGAPKYMEWYAGFGLLVTLVWLYMEFLRLLSLLSSE